MGADHPASYPDLSPRSKLLADVLAASGDRGHALVVGQAHEDPLDVLVDRRGQQ
jgi:hypothetical protein